MATALDALTRHATDVGAKVLLVGDPAQLGAVTAGGAFIMFTDDRDSARVTPPCPCEQVGEQPTSRASSAL